MNKEVLHKLIQMARATYPDSKIMQRVAVTQAVHESGYHNRPQGSTLAREHNNLFGIKAKGTDGWINMNTGEHINGRDIRVNDGFGKNLTAMDSFKQHRRLMEIKRYRPVLLAGSESEAFVMLYKCGYATDPRYPGKLQFVYDKYVKGFV